jgi:hypothetical protein
LAGCEACLGVSIFLYDCLGVSISGSEQPCEACPSLLCDNVIIGAETALIFLVFRALEKNVSY